MEQKKQTYLRKFKEKILNSENPEIRKDIRTLKKMMSNEDWEIFVSVVVYQNVDVLLEKNIDINEIEDEQFIELMHRCVDSMKDALKSLTIKVELEYLEDEYYRIMEVPYNTTLSHIAYLILASFKADGSHLFSVNHKKQCYACDINDYAELFAFDTFISDLNLRKNSHFEVEYDFGDEWLFKVTVLSTNKHKEIFNEEDTKILKGKGYNIWEDEHSLMEYFFNEHDRFIERIEENGFEEEDYIEEFHLDEDFNVEKANKQLLYDFDYLKCIYEE